jgi:hypothetical protein
MAEIVKFAGAFGYRANGLDLEQVCILTDGTVHKVVYDGRSRTKAGMLIDDYNPAKERLYTYSQVRRACQKARTEERLYGIMSIVGPAGGMTRFGIEIGRMQPVTTAQLITKLAFEGVDAAAVIALNILFYAEVNAD